MNVVRSQWLAGGVVLALAAVGCQDKAPPVVAPAGPAAKSPQEHAHEHPSHGPHGGDLVELGKEEYHAEVVHDDKAGTVTIYLLDGAAKAAVPIAAAQVTINASHEGKAEQFTLAAKPLEGESDGQSSRFESPDKELGEHLEHGARLVVEIKGKSYTGAIKHDHDHGHKH